MADPACWSNYRERSRQATVSKPEPCARLACSPRHLAGESLRPSFGVAGLFEQHTLFALVAECVRSFDAKLEIGGFALAFVSDGGNAPREGGGSRCRLAEPGRDGLTRVHAVRGCGNALQEEGPAHRPAPDGASRRSEASRR
jgi:hypothetical protein